MDQGPSVVVVGGGISGLTAAHRLQTQGYAVTILERESSPGGRMSSVRRDGFILNRAANILPSSYGAISALVAELGLADTIDDVTGLLAVPRGGVLKQIRSSGAGMVLDVLRTDLLSARSKATAVHLLTDAVRMRKHLSYANLGDAAGFDTETAAQYCDRRLTPELQEFLVEPIVRALFTSEADRVSVVDFFFAAVNFVGSGFMRYPGGIGFLPEALARRLDVRTAAEVREVEEHSDHVVVHWTDPGQEHSTRAEAAVIAVSADLVPGLYPALDARRREILTERLEYGTTLVGHFALTRRPHTAAMVVPVPASLDPDLCVVTLDHNISPTAAPAGQGLVSSYWLHEWSRQRLAAADDVLGQEMLRGVEKVLPGVGEHVRFSHIDRWETSVIRSYPGMYTHVAEFARLTDASSRVQLTGDYLSASSTNGCAVSAERAAERVAALLA